MMYIKDCPDVLSKFVKTLIHIDGLRVRLAVATRATWLEAWLQTSLAALRGIPASGTSRMNFSFGFGFGQNFGFCLSLCLRLCRGLFGPLRRFRLSLLPSGLAIRLRSPRLATLRLAAHKLKLATLRRATLGLATLALAIAVRIRPVCWGGFHGLTAPKLRISPFAASSNGILLSLPH